LSKLEERLAKQLDEAGVKYERELMLIPGRRFRFDFVVPQACLVIEAEGGTWSGGRHTSGVGFRNDCEKYNLALEHGWRVLRFTSDMIGKGLAVEQIVRILNQDASEGRSDAL
jgi:very-short-patch-repair endonuclease